METAYRVMFKDYPGILNAEEVGKILGIGRKQVYKLIQMADFKKFLVAEQLRLQKPM